MVGTPASNWESSQQTGSRHSHAVHTSSSVVAPGVALQSILLITVVIFFYVMLARHLLFLATCRPNNALLVVQPNESVSSSMFIQHQQCPSYVGPPEVQKMHQEHAYNIIYNNRSQQQNLPNNQMYQNFSSNSHKQHNYNYDHHQIVYEKNNLHHNDYTQTYSNYTENQMFAKQVHNSVERYEKNQQQFYTLPNKKPSREIIIESPRSVTPDITRSLVCRPPLSAMHMLAKQGQKSDSTDKIVGHHHSQTTNCQLNLNRKNLEQFEARCKFTEQEQQTNVSVDAKNRFVSPLGLSALGYRFFASHIQDNLKASSISPEYTNCFKSSTLTGRLTPTVAERLVLQRCISPNLELLRHATSEKQLHSSTPVDSGRSTPTGLMLSPIKSTMSNEELFAAIHKSKRRLNIRDSQENLSPAGSLTSLSKRQQAVGTRHSWSPESQKTLEIPKNVLSSSTTSRLDFKRLLLQQSIKTGPTRISATEQLKISRQQAHESQQHQQYQLYSPVSKLSQQVLTKVLSPRSAWRFHTPRTDVLSSTIIEDAAAEEKAMKPSPENPVPAPRVILKLGQLDTCKIQRSMFDKSEKELENRLQAKRPVHELSSSIKAIENRRMSNQLARAQFLAASVSSLTSKEDSFGKHFRARSESPQQNSQRLPPETLTQITTSVVARSPSAPALETAL